MAETATPRPTLRRRREQQGWSQESLAIAMNVATSTYRSWERGAKVPLPGRRPRLAKHLDVSLAELNRMLNGDVGAPTAQAVPAWLGHLAALEQGASHLWAFEPVVVHSLLQTAEYAEVVERSDLTPRSDDAVARRVEYRLARQHVVTREADPLRLSVVLDESVLHREAGSCEVMASQLDHLITLTRLPNVDLRVLPLNAGAFAIYFGAFLLLRSPDSPAPYMAITEDRGGPNYLDREPDIELHDQLFRHLLERSLSASDTLDLIEETNRERYL